MKCLCLPQIKHPSRNFWTNMIFSWVRPFSQGALHPFWHTTCIHGTTNRWMYRPWSYLPFLLKRDSKNHTFCLLRSCNNTGFGSCNDTGLGSCNDTVIFNVKSCRNLEVNTYTRKAIFKVTKPNHDYCWSNHNWTDKSASRSIKGHHKLDTSI